jgi:hypothetical protein
MTRFEATSVPRSRGSYGALASVAVGLTAGCLLGVGFIRWFNVEAMAWDFACSHLTAIVAIHSCAY